MYLSDDDLGRRVFSDSIHCYVFKFGVSLLFHLHLFLVLSHLHLIHLTYLLLSSFVMNLHKPSFSLVLNFAILRHFPRRGTCRSWPLIWMQDNMKTYTHMTVPWPSVIDTACGATLTLGSCSNVVAPQWSGMSLSRCIGSKVYCPFVGCFEEVEYSKDLSTLLQRFKAQPLSQLGLLHIVLHCRFSHLYLAGRFDYWAHNCSSDPHLKWYVWGYLTAGIASNCLQFYRCIIQVVSLRAMLEARVGRISPILPSAGSSICMLYWIFLEATSSSGFGLVLCNFCIRGMLIYLVSRADLRWYLSVCFWW